MAVYGCCAASRPGCTTVAIVLISRPESLDRPGFAGDVDAGVRPGEDEGGQGLGGRGDRDVGSVRRGPGGEADHSAAVVFRQVVRTVEPEVPAGWLIIAGGEVDGLGDGPAVSACSSSPPGQARACPPLARKRIEQVEVGFHSVRDTRPSAATCGRR